MRTSCITAEHIARALIEECEGKSSKSTATLVDAAIELIVTHNLYRDLPRFPAIVEDILKMEKGIRSCHLTVASSPENAATSVEKILKSWGGTWNMTLETDVDLLGGMKLRVGDDQIDASVRSALHQLSSHLSL